MKAIRKYIGLFFFHFDCYFDAESSFSAFCIVWCMISMLLSVILLSLSLLLFQEPMVEWSVFSSFLIPLVPLYSLLLKKGRMVEIAESVVDSKMDGAKYKYLSWLAFVFFSFVPLGTYVFLVNH